MAKFLFDLDETLYIGDLVKVAVAELRAEGYLIYHGLSGRDAADFEFSNFPEVLRERLFKIFSDPTKGCFFKEPLPGAYAYLYFLMKEGHEIGFVTSRPNSLHEASKEVLKRDFPKIKWSFEGFANNYTIHMKKISKTSLIREWRPDFYFDDYHGYCLEASSLGVPNVYLISNSHTGWNYSYVWYPSDSRIKIIKSILDIDLRRFSNGI